MQFNRERVFGIELEFDYKRKVTSAEGSSLQSINLANLAAYLTQNGLETKYQGYTHATTAFWKLVPDGSCGYELVSPLLQGEEGLQAAAKAATLLTQYGARVNKRCGLHVHHDARDLTGADMAKAITYYTKFQEPIDFLLAPSRRQNTFARKLNLVEVKQIAAQKKSKEQMARFFQTRFARYRVVNFAAYLLHGSIEFRQHQGTLDADKITAWIIFTQAFINKGQAVKFVSFKQAHSKHDMFEQLLWRLDLHTEDDAVVKAALVTLRAQYRKFKQAAVRSTSAAMPAILGDGGQS